MKLFISYASEDQEFAESIYQALIADVQNQVWFAPYELVPGDSLLRKIGAGLRECDYGIVVLSPAFFGKKWTQAELDGLFALEDTKRKIIIPIWKDLNEKQVAAFNPIIAGKLAISATQPAEQIVKEILLAANYTKRGAAFGSKSSIAAKFAKVTNEQNEVKRSIQALSTSQGCDILCSAMNDCFGAIEQDIADIVAGTGAELSFSYTNHPIPSNKTLVIAAAYKIYMTILFRTATNAGSGAIFSIDFGRIARGRSGRHRGTGALRDG